MESTSDKFEMSLKKDRKRSLWRLFIASIVCIVFVIVIFVVGGLIAKSLSLITEALHMVSDLGTIIINFLSIAIATIKANQTFTFGFHRAGMIPRL